MIKQLFNKLMFGTEPQKQPELPLRPDMAAALAEKAELLLEFSECRGVKSEVGRYATTFSESFPTDSGLSRLADYLQKLDVYCQYSQAEGTLIVGHADIKAMKLSAAAPQDVADPYARPSPQTALEGMRYIANMLRERSHCPASVQLTLMIGYTRFDAAPGCEDSLRGLFTYLEARDVHVIPGADSTRPHLSVTNMEMLRLASIWDAEDDWEEDDWEEDEEELDDYEKSITVSEERLDRLLAIEKVARKLAEAAEYRVNHMFTGETSSYYVRNDDLVALRALLEIGK